MVLNVQDYNALDLAQPTNFKAMLHSGELLLGAALFILDEKVARIVAQLPHEFCFLDNEHAPFNPTNLTSIIRAINYYSQGRMTPYVRVAPGATAPDIVHLVLDAGAGGIVMAHTQTAAQASDFVKLCRYPPHGERSYPPGALLPGRQSATPAGKTVYDVWNDHQAVVCQIEDEEAIRNLEEICQVPGVDALMVGTGDLRASMGYGMGSIDGDEPEFIAAMDEISRIAKKYNKPVLGFALDPVVAAKRIERGWVGLVAYADSFGIFMSGQGNYQSIVAAGNAVKAAKDAKAAVQESKVSETNGE